MLLGLGPDGHVASLFPNRSQVAATDSWVLPVENSPKPPPERITMSLPVINRCACQHCHLIYPVSSMEANLDINWSSMPVVILLVFLSPWRLA